MNSLSLFRENLENLAEELLTPYINRLGPNQIDVRRTKEFNDPVWQTIVLYPFEIIVLDSPLLQRLRYVRQLGVAQWVYPGAVHTRFEHSIGAVCLVQKLIDSINRQSVRQDLQVNTVLDAKSANLLRATALCHDIGHGFMSHVSENAMNSLAHTAALQREFRDSIPGGLNKAPSLSETAAYFLVGSPSFARLIDDARRMTGHLLPTDPVKNIQNALIGGIIDEQRPMVQELISGPYDADKLDYMNRDAYAAGVPSVTDIPRLIQKVRCVALTENQLPDSIARSIRGGHKLYYLNAIALSGASTLDELMLGRILLFEKVYRHQKVRASEAMVERIVQTLCTAMGDRDLLVPLLLTDDDLLSTDLDRVLKKLGIDPEASSSKEMQSVESLARGLYERQLFIAAYAFSHYMPDDAFRWETIQKLGYDQAARDVQRPEARVKVHRAIVDTVRKMLGHIGDEDLPQAVIENIESFVALDPPAQSNQTSEIASAYLVTKDDTLIPFRQESAESQGWSNAYPLARDVGYVFCTRELAEATYLASEIVFRKLYEIRTPSTVFDYVKVKRERVADLRLLLTSKGFYDNHPNELRAPPARMQMADVGTKIAAIAERLRQFEGLEKRGERGQDVVWVDHARVTSWLRQFRTDEELDAALSMLMHVHMVTRDDVHGAVRRFLDAHPAFEGAAACPFGGPMDSSSIVTYYANDFHDEFGIEAMRLNDALAGIERPILFLDDFISTGAQGRTILLNWFGRPADAPLQEFHGNPLSADARAALLRREVGFVFACGVKSGTEALLAECSRLGLRASVGIGILAADLPRAFDDKTVQYSSEATKSTFRARCREIGRELLRTSRGDQNEEWIEGRALGYGNQGLLVAFPYNTPTQSLTMLWSSGTVDGWAWLPLIPRRAKR